MLKEIGAAVVLFILFFHLLALTIEARDLEQRVQKLERICYNQCTREADSACAERCKKAGHCPGQE